MGGKINWLIAVDEFSDYSHSFFLRKKSDQTVVIPIWIKGLKTKYGIVVKNRGWIIVEKTGVARKSARNRTLE